MRPVLLLAAVLTMAPIGLAQEKTDKDRIQGEWKIVSWKAGAGVQWIAEQNCPAGSNICAMHTMSANSLRLGGRTQELFQRAATVRLSS